MNKVRIGSSTSINMLSFRIRSISKHLEQFLAEITSLTFGVKYKIPSYEAMIFSHEVGQQMEGE